MDAYLLGADGRLKHTEPAAPAAEPPSPATSTPELQTRTATTHATPTAAPARTPVTDEEASD